MEGDERVKNAHGIVGAHGADFFQFSVMEVVDAQALNLAHGVVDDDEALVPSGGIGRAGGVRQVMADLMDVIEREAGQIASHLGQQGIAGENLVVEASGNFVPGIESAVGSVIETVCDFVDFKDGEAGLSKAKVDGVDGKVASVLFAAKTLLLGGSNQFAVDDQCGSGVHPLGDAVFAFVQSRPMGPLEGHRIFQSADSDHYHRYFPCNKSPSRSLVRGCAHHCRRLRVLAKLFGR